MLPGPRVQYIHLCNYPMSMFKKLYNKLLAIKKLCCITSWASFVHTCICTSKIR